MVVSKRSYGTKKKWKRSGGMMKMFRKFTRRTPIKIEPESNVSPNSSSSSTDFRLSSSSSLDHEPSTEEELNPSIPSEVKNIDDSDDSDYEPDDPETPSDVVHTHTAPIYIMDKYGNEWQQFWDNSVGSNYYFDEKNRHAQWQRPEELKTHDSDGETPDKDGNEWPQFWDDSVGSNYYFDEKNSHPEELKTHDSDVKTPNGGNVRLQSKNRRKKTKRYRKTNQFKKMKFSQKKALQN